MQPWMALVRGPGPVQMLLAPAIPASMAMGPVVRDADNATRMPIRRSSAKRESASITCRAAATRAITGMDSVVVLVLLAATSLANVSHVDN